jgi:hypothetical protein
MVGVLFWRLCCRDFMIPQKPERAFSKSHLTAAAIKSSTTSRFRVDAC